MHPTPRQYKQEQQWKTKSGTNETATIKMKNNYNEKQLFKSHK
jgi:hypothetical protein